MLSTTLTQLRRSSGLAKTAVASSLGVALVTVHAWETLGHSNKRPSPEHLQAYLDLAGATTAQRAEAWAKYAAHRRTTTVATEGTDSRNGPTVLDGRASTSIGVSSAAQDERVSGAGVDVSNMMTSGDPLNVADPHRHTQPLERDE